MIPEFLLRAWLASAGLALVAGPLGCFVVWRRMAYFGDTLSHSALLGVSLGLLIGVDPMIGVAFTTVSLALLILLLQQQRRLATDTVLGILAHSGLALGIVCISLQHSVRVDLLGYLFGDVLAVSWLEVAVVWAGGAACLAMLAWIWRRLLFVTIHEELAQAEGLSVLGMRFVLLLLLAVVIAAAMKIVGILLITSMLIIPAAAARALARDPEWMAVLAALAGVLAATFGLAGSFFLDTPTGPSIVVAALLLFCTAQVIGGLDSWIVSARNRVRQQ